MPSIDRRRPSTLPRVLVIAMMMMLPAVLTFTASPVSADDGSADPYVKDLYFEGEPAVNQTVTVVAVIGNKGDSTFGGGNWPWRVCFTWNVSIGREHQCEAQGMNSPFSLNQGGLQQDNNRRSSVPMTSSIPPGGEVEARIEWTPHETQPRNHPQAGDGTVWVRFSRLNDFPSTTRDIHPDNNERPFPASVQRVGIKLWPAWDGTFLPVNEIERRCTTYEIGTTDGNCRVKPGDVLRLKLKVINSGNRQDRFALYQYATGRGNESLGCDSMPCEWNVTFSSPAVTVPAYGERSVDVTLEVPRTGELAQSGRTINGGTYGSDSAPVRIKAVSLTDPGKEDDTFVPRLVVDQLHAVNMTTWQPVRVANVTKSVQFNFSVGNPGNGRDTYGIEFVRSESTVNASHWRIADSLEQLQDLELQAFRNETFSLTASVPVNASQGFHDFTLRVFSHEDESTFADLSFRAFVMQHYQISQTLERNSIADRAAETVVYPLQIHNEGNGLDNVEVRLDEQRVPPEWRVLLDGRSVSQLTLPVPLNETRIVNVTVTSPAGEREGRVGFVNLTARTSGPEKTPREERQELTFTTRTEVLKAPNFFLTPKARQLTGIFIDPNQTLAFDLDVANVGNLWDNVTVTAPDVPPGWKVDFTTDLLDLAPPRRFISHPTEGTTTLRVTAPRSADVGEEASVTVEAKSTVDPTLTRSVTYSFRVSGPDLAVTGISVDKQHVYAGDPVNVTVSVVNTGNKQPAEDPVLRVLYASGGSERIVRELTLQDFGGGASRSIPVAWETQGLAGAGTLIARIDPGDDIVEIAESNNERLLSSDQTFVRLFDVRLQPATGLTVRAGERVLYEEVPNAFVLQNFGNRDEPVTVTIRSENGWFDTITRTETVKPSEEKVLGFQFDVPGLPGVARDTVLVDVVPDYRPGSPLSSTVRTRLADDAPPEIANVKVSPDAPTVATPVTVTATITDALGVESATAIFRTPLNDSRSVPMEKKAGSDEWSATETLGVAGEYRVFVEAVDSSAGQNRGDSRASFLTFTVSPGSAPTIEPVTDLTVPVRSGTVLEFRIADAGLGVARVYYVLGNDEYETPVSGRIDTSDWAPGSTTFTLVAENTYGVRTEETFTVEVDNTPPTLTKVELNPSNPKAGESTTITITVDASVDAVELVIKRDGETVDRLDAQKRGPGRFEAKYTPGAGKFSVDAIAQDAAGNTQSMESSVVFSTTGLVPAPGALVAVLVGLGVAAFAGRRARKA